MHHVNEDPRCLKSCLLIREALFDLLEENNYRLHDVSVSDIADRATVSRATFYRHFDLPLDVLIWTSNQEVRLSADATPLFSSNYRLFCRNFFEYWVANCGLLETLVATGHSYIFLHSLEKYLKDVAPKLLENSTLPENQKEFLVGIWSAIVWAVLKQWILNDKRETAEELTDIALHSLPRPR